MYERTYHKAVLKTDEGSPAKRGRKHINWKLLVWILGTVVVITGLVVVIRLPGVQVRTVTVNGANVVDPGDVSQFVTNQLQGDKLAVLPKASIFIVPTDTLAKEIKAAFPRLQTVTVKRKGFSALTVTVTEFQGVYLWCTDESICYFMDQNGTVFASAPYFSGNAYPKIFIGSLRPLPFQGLTADQIATLQLLLDHLGSLGIVPSEFHYVSDHDLDIYFIHNGQQAVLRFDPTMDMNDEITALFTGLRTDPLATKFNEPNEVLQYIDLRFLDRVVYKFQ